MKLYMPVFLIFVTSIFICSAAQRYDEGKPDEDGEQGKALAFPGAEGFGKYTTGGRGGAVYKVTNLQDKGAGSFREAIEAKGKRTIVFDVSGTIALESPLEIKNGDVTIAGQTAPGDGICIKNYALRIKAGNVIIRYMRFRMGDEHKQQDDAINVLRQKDVIIDHCSMSWATDEVATFYDNENFTLQWSIISESLRESVHRKGQHGYGGIWGGKGASFHHNLIAHHSSRTPRFNGSRYHKDPDKELVDFRNNVIYNWLFNNAYGGERGNHNIVNNYYKAGPATEKSKINRILNPSEPYGRFYVEGNFVEGAPDVTKDNWNGGVQCKAPPAAKSDMVFPVEYIREKTAQQAFREVLSQAGASLKRDEVDSRIVQEVANGTATYGKEGIINSQSEVGGWPQLSSGIPKVDSDNDGMPDDWELQKGLNPHDAADGAVYKLSQMYTNLEVYLNSLIE